MKKLLLLPILAIMIAGCSKTPVVVEEPQVEVIETKVPEGLEVCAFFTEEFMDKYQYEDSKGYMFAIKIDGYYYNVFRNENGGVSNSQKHGLTGAVPAYLFKQPYCWRIPFGEIKVAKKNEYGFEYINFELKRIDIDSYYDIEISPVKEGVETHTIGYEFY